MASRSQNILVSCILGKTQIALDIEEIFVSKTILLQTVFQELASTAQIKQKSAEELPDPETFHINFHVYEEC